VVYGASDNTLQQQHDFACKYNLRMPLLSDTSGSYRALLGNPDGAEAAARTTYIVDAEGVVREIIGVPRIGADEHAQAALDSIRALRSS
jgi:peroxiredoxin